MNFQSQNYSIFP